DLIVFGFWSKDPASADEKGGFDIAVTRATRAFLPDDLARASGDFVPILNLGVTLAQIRLLRDRNLIKEGFVRFHLQSLGKSHFADGCLLRIINGKFHFIAS